MVNWVIDVVGYGNTGYGVFKFLSTKLDINLLRSDQIFEILFDQKSNDGQGSREYFCQIHLP